MVISVSDSSNLSNLANPSRLTQIPTASDALLVTTGVSTQRERLAEVWVIPAQTKDKKKSMGGRIQGNCCVAPEGQTGLESEPGVESVLAKPGSDKRRVGVSQHFSSTSPCCPSQLRVEAGDTVARLTSDDAASPQCHPVYGA